MKKEDLIKEVYSELLELGWPDNLVKEETKYSKYSDVLNFDYAELYPKTFNLNPNPKSSGWIFDNQKLKERIIELSKNKYKYE